jgi:Tol biopolymer transport system component
MRLSSVAAAAAALVLLALGAPATGQSAGNGPQPLCRSTEAGPLGNEAHPGDGTPDPAGRIAYATVGRFDPAFGPIGTRLFAIDPDGSDSVLLLDCDVARPQWSPDGSRLAFTIGMDDGSWQVATVAADGSDLRLLTSGPGIHEIPAWAPEGSWLAYDASDVGLDDPAFRTTLRRVGADGSGAAALGDPGTFDVEPRLSPDGIRLAFGRLLPDQGFASPVLVRDLASGAERQVTPPGASFEHPEWAPDGHTLIFNGRDDMPDKGTIYTLDVDRDDATPVVVLDPSTGRGGVKPVYAPDGSRIVFVCSDEAGEGVCLMDVDGSDVSVLVDDPSVPENFSTWGAAAH